jgi:hypothetical protein
MENSHPKKTYIKKILIIVRPYCIGQAANLTTAHPGLQALKEEGMRFCY